MRKLTHSELCDLCVAHAVKRGAVLVTAESGGTEKPDVFALFPDGSTVVYECKASRADFRADRDKPFRKDPSKGMGEERIYVVNEGVCSPGEIPYGWRLAYAGDLNDMRMVIPCFPVSRAETAKIHTFERDADAEMVLISSVLASGRALVPPTFDITLVWEKPGPEVLGRLKDEGRCPFCRNTCTRNQAESFTCGDFKPDYSKLYG